MLCLPYCVMAISAGQEQYSNVENVLLGVLSLVICIANLCLMQIVTSRFISGLKTRCEYPECAYPPKSELNLREMLEVQQKEIGNLEV